MKPVSFIIAMHVHFPDSEKEYNHVCSSRCAVYIYDSLESFIPYSILINFEDENYRIFFSNVDQRCYVNKNYEYKFSTFSDNFNDSDCNKKIMSKNRL